MSNNNAQVVESVVSQVDELNDDVTQNDINVAVDLAAHDEEDFVTDDDEDKSACDDMSEFVPSEVDGEITFVKQKKGGAGIQDYIQQEIDRRWKQKEKELERRWKTAQGNLEPTGSKCRTNESEFEVEGNEVQNRINQPEIQNPNDIVERENNFLRGNTVKSPSDTTIYAPGLQRIPA